MPEKKTRDRARRDGQAKRRRHKRENSSARNQAHPRRETWGTVDPASDRHRAVQGSPCRCESSPPAGDGQGEDAGERGIRRTRRAPGAQADQQQALARDRCGIEA